MLRKLITNVNTTKRSVIKIVINKMRYASQNKGDNVFRTSCDKFYLLVVIVL